MCNSLKAHLIFVAFLFLVSQQKMHNLVTLHFLMSSCHQNQGLKYSELKVDRGMARINCLILGYTQTILGHSRGTFYFQSQPGQGLRVMKEVNFVIAPDEGKYNSRQLDIKKADI